MPVRRVPRGESRNPATISPLEGSITSPQAFTTVRAPTTSGPLLRDAEPSPDFMARPIPRSLPTLAPVPAPTLPCVIGRWLAARQALRAMPAVGRARGLPTERSKMMAAVTIGTMASPTRNPTPRFSRKDITPEAASSP